MREMKRMRISSWYTRTLSPTLNTDLCLRHQIAQILWHYYRMLLLWSKKTTTHLYSHTGRVWQRSGRSHETKSPYSTYDLVWESENRYTNFCLAIYFDSFSGYTKFRLSCPVLCIAMSKLSVASTWTTYFILVKHFRKFHHKCWAQLGKLPIDSHSITRTRLVSL